LGFYAVDPVSGHYVFGTPLVDHAEIQVGNGKVLRVTVKRASPSDAFIQSVKLNGTQHSKLWFRHSDIAAGGQIEFTMGPQPSTEFGRGEAAIPPSMPEVG
jgi:putative alpha-1,2-mannosidase